MISICSMTLYCEAIFIEMQAQGKVPFVEWWLYTEHFRDGEYEEASEDVKTAWIYFCERILTIVCKEWNEKQVRANKLVTEVVSSSDEAFAIQEIEGRHMKITIQKILKKTDAKKLVEPVVASEQDPTGETEVHAELDSNGDEILPMKPGRKSLIKEKERQERYYFLVREVTGKREKSSSVSWDIGYRDAVVRRRSVSPSGSNGNEEDSDDEAQQLNSKTAGFPANFVAPELDKWVGV